MVSCCVNPACRTEFRSLNTGVLYAVERRSVDTEFFWLCSACVPVVTMAPCQPRPRADALKRIWTRSAFFVERGRISLANIKTPTDMSEREQKTCKHPR